MTVLNDIVTVEVSFTDNAFDTPVWTDISSMVTSVDIGRGRQHELSRFEAGKCTVTIAPLSPTAPVGDFDPANPASPYYPNVDVDKPLRVSVTILTEVVYLFTGWTQAWRTTWNNDMLASVQVDAYDALRLFGRSTLNSSSYAKTALNQAAPTSILGGVAWYRCDEQSGTTAFDQSGNGNNALYQGPMTFSQPGALVFDTDTSIGTRGGHIQIDTSVATGASFQGWFQTHLQIDQILVARRDILGNIVVQVTIQADGNIEIIVGSASPIIVNGLLGPVNDGLWHYVAYSGGGGTNTPGFAIDGVIDVAHTYAVATPASTDHMAIGADYAHVYPLIGNIDEWIVYDLVEMDLFWAVNGTFGPYSIGQALAASETTGFVIDKVLRYGMLWQASTTLADGYIAPPVQTTSIGSQNALQYLQSLEATEGPKLGVGQSTNRAAFFIKGDGVVTITTPDAPGGGQTFTDRPSGDDIGPYVPGAQFTLDDLDLYGMATVQNANGALQQATSVLGAVQSYKYGTPQILQFSSMLYPNDADALERANWEIDFYQTPKVRFPSLSFHTITMPDAMQLATAKVELADAGTLIRHVPYSTDPQSYIVEVEHIHHVLDLTSGDWSTEILFIPCNIVGSP